MSEDDSRDRAALPTPTYRLYITAKASEYERFLKIMKELAPDNKAATLRKLMDHYESTTRND